MQKIEYCTFANKKKEKKRKGERKNLTRIFKNKA